MRAIQAAALTLGLCLNLPAWGVEPNHCAPYANNSSLVAILRDLAAKLQYDYEQFCASPRIMDIYHETRSVYIRERDIYQDHLFVTLHYNEYSCEYQYNLVEDRWGEQQCYGTW